MTPGLQRRRSVVYLTLGSLGSGVLAYIFFITATRALGPRDAASVAVLWTYWSLTGAAITFPLQHWITRTVEATGGQRAVRSAVPRLAATIIGIAVVTGLGSALAGDRLFPSGGVEFPLFVGAVTVGAGLLGLQRGLQSAQERFAAVGLNLVVENALRTVAALALVGAGYSEPWAFGIALILGYGVVLVDARTLVTMGSGKPGSVARPVTAVGSAAVGQLLAQVALTGGPVVLALLGGRPEQVTALFAGLALFRAPYTVGVALMAPVTAAFTRVWLDGSPARWRRVELTVLALALVGSALATAGGYWAGPWLVALVFGEGVVLSAGLAALLGLGTAMALSNTVVAVMLIAQARQGALARGWAVAVVAGAVWLAVTAWDPDAAVATMFVGVEGVALAWLGVEQRRAARSVH